MPRTSGVSALLALALGLSLLTAPASATASATAPATSAVPTISWHRCEEGPGADGRLECATVPVPLDYDRPTGPTLALDVLRVPASHPAHRIGTLFVNPGGPGGSSRQFAADFRTLVPAEVSRRFDVVGIDPRGVGPSAFAICRNPQRRPPFPESAFPTGPREVRRRLAFDRWERNACRVGEHRVVNHMTTADTARDMDLVRQSLGDAQLTYYGISYGTQLGTTYAAMFPDHVRAMILDGVLDPVAWSTGRRGSADLPFSARVGSDRGSWRTLTHALAACDDAGRRRCAIAGDAMGVWRDIVRRLHRGPFQGITYADLVSGTIGLLYSPRGLRLLVRQLGLIHRAMSAGGTLRRPGAWRARAVTVRTPGVLPGPYARPGSTPHVGHSGYAITADPFAGVACADTDNPGDPRDWVVAARRADRRAPWFGAAWTWTSSVCAGWPARTRADRFTGPYDATTSSPVLVVGNTFDPATPISGARAVARLLHGSRLLTLDGFGHGALDSGPCIRRSYADYLVRGTLPAEGTVCRPGRPLFPGG